MAKELIHTMQLHFFTRLQKMLALEEQMRNIQCTEIDTHGFIEMKSRADNGVLRQTAAARTHLPSPREKCAVKQAADGQDLREVLQ